jgi:hypothetical protein
VSVLFASLENYSTFWFPTRKGAFVKNSFCTARVGSAGGWLFVNPLRSVLVKAPAKLSKASMAALCAPWPGKLVVSTADESNIPAGIPTLGPIGGCCGGSCPCNDRPRGDEPHNDNNITGPTC